MKPEYEKIIEPAERSFTAKVVNRSSRPLLSQAWHYHPELEICFTLKSSGRRFVGNQIADYQVGDLVMMGTNLPHGFTTDVYCSQIVVQMTENFLGRDFLNTPETRPIRTLFQRAGQGLSFHGNTQKKSSKLLREILKHEGMTKLRYLLELLQLLAESEEVSSICSLEYAMDLNVEDLGRIKVVYDHVMENFREEVSIPEMAAQLNISEAAFYKFIKKHTKKTYTQIINEFRINHAGKLLMSTDKSITEICFESGFNNISYFNRKFKQLMTLTPDGFRKRYK
ncbi:AraC family transcriptional regulator [Neolewinella agarilytica]|uniref:AraC-type DNA-binding protein n=1 Tax=Neolewinella agarilytica TaxID=478744 RepID=A0A1H9JJT7_9BACT|nr:AraC family transcriptional regulator [Neolewinella agarilytica]SEQ87057.1 AraC-type DNA-binding protein [Neolewinella agarilytica]